ncbi:MAG TPA: DUF1570 domain-containing protein [Phycisphaerae bacterium]|nr:DUF1570 domain-containing protein [Phycisphaerae bacterium]
MLRGIAGVLIVACVPAACGAARGHGADARSPAEQAARTGLLGEFGEGFSVHETEHFLLVHNVKGVMAKWLAGQMEGTYKRNVALARSLRVPIEESPQRLEVVLLDRFEQFAEYAESVGFVPENTRGFYDERKNRSTFYNAFNDPQVEEFNLKVDQLEAREGSRSSQVRELRQYVDRHARSYLRAAMRHELSHQVQFNCGLLPRGADTPVWLAEGLACLFEPAGSTGPHSQTINQVRLRRFHETAEKNELMGIRELLNARPQAGDDLERADRFYAQAWALVYYLVRYRARLMATYLETIRSRVPGQETPDEEEIAVFERVFGEIDERMDGQWHKAILRIKPASAR